MGTNENKRRGVQNMSSAVNELHASEKHQLSSRGVWESHVRRQFEVEIEVEKHCVGDPSGSDLRWRS